MRKQCDACGNFFECLNDFSNCWCSGIIINSEKLEKISYSGENCFCKDCLLLLNNNEIIQRSREIEIETNFGKITLGVKKKKQYFFINLHNKEYRYPLFSEKFDNYAKATVKFYHYKKMLEKNDFKIIRNIDALDDKYRRIYSRVKFGILFNY